MLLKEFNNGNEFVSQVVTLVTTLANEAIKQTGAFHIVLCGGRTPVPIYEALRLVDTNWSLWHFWLGDERMPSALAGLNRDLIEESWLAHIPAKRENVHYIPVELGIEEAVKQYNDSLKTVNLFDLSLLGVGEDGHTASLFPGNDLGESGNSLEVLPVFNSPKAPKERISLSAKRLGLSKKVLFIAQGKEKKNIIDRIQSGEDLPCNAIKGETDSLLYYYN